MCSFSVWVLRRKASFSVEYVTLSLGIHAFLELMAQITYRSSDDVRVLLNAFLQMEKGELLGS